MSTSVGSRLVAKADRLSLLLAKKSVQRLQRAKHRTDKKVVFVAGVQRSGTNMTMDVLERSFQTDVYHERDSRAFKDYEMHPREVMECLIAASQGEWVVVKALCEMQEIRRLLDCFEPARAVWVIRDYRDVVNSHTAIWTGMPASIKQIVEDRNGAGWRGRGMSDEIHRVVCDIYTPEISNASACALFWYFRNTLFFDQALDQDPRVRLVHYESLVQEPERSFRELMTWLGLRYSARLTNKIFASSIRRKVPPEINPKIARLCQDLTDKFDQLTVR